MEKLAVNIPMLVEKLLSPNYINKKADEDWDSDGEKSPPTSNNKVTSSHTEQSSTLREATTSSSSPPPPQPSQSSSSYTSENNTEKDNIKVIPPIKLTTDTTAEGPKLKNSNYSSSSSRASSGAGSPIDKETREAFNNTLKNLAERLSASRANAEERSSPSGSAKSSPSSSPNNATTLSQPKLEREATPVLPHDNVEVTMKEETVSPSPPILSPTSLKGPSSPTLSSEAEAARQQLANMIQGLPILSMLPALHHLATPGVVASLASGLSNFTNTQSSSSGNITNGLTCLCGIRFSSVTNLEAHRMFYCTQRLPLNDNDSVVKENRTTPPTVSPRIESATDEDDGNRILRCPHCPYTTTHKLSLNGHMNIHTSPEELAKPSTSPQTAASTTNGDIRAKDRYCIDCDIQFSSMKTFRVHKTHYCQTRHVLKGGNKSPVREDIGSNAVNSALAGMVNAAVNNSQPILALPTNPILLVPYSLVAGARLLPPHMLPQQGAAVVLPNGQVQPLSPGHLQGPALPALLSPNSSNTTTTATTTTQENTSPGSHNLPTATQTSSQSKPSSPPKQNSKDEPKVKSSSGEVLGKRRGEGESPLDLTTKRPKLIIKTDLLNDEEKENREVNTPTLTKSPAPRIRPGSSFGAGEFEGKLLASPPRPIPSNDSDSHSNPRSPRPASAAPTLGSPRGLAESPRPSTSMRSPGQHSQLPSALPQLPPGFPNLLAGLENLTNLANLQSLQGVPPELALKLLSPDLLMNGLAPMVNPPVIVKQGEAKCNECNIVFYKEESLQVHKKHYCAARPTVKSEEDRTSSGTSKSPVASNEGNAGPSQRSPTTLSEVPVVSANNSSASVTKDASKPNKPLLQFICSACGIKFTSPDNLNAHQTYYCPKREGASCEDGVTKGLWRCPRCRCAMPETLQAAHQCVTPSPAPSHGWKCPCCPVISPTAAAAQKHLESHAGIKAFRCTICGYRGNTLRGMRTHIRMHFEKRTNDLQEENFIACILEDDENNTMAAEVRGVADLPRVILENPTLSALLAEGAAADRSEQPLTCHFCPFVTPFRNNLARHLAFAHKVGFDAKLTQDLQALLESRLQESTETSAPQSETPIPVENGNPVSPPPLPAIKLEPEVKLEVDESEDRGRTGSLPHSPEISIKTETPVSVSSNNNSTETPKHCNSCNITFSYLDSFLAHKRFYCTKPESSTPPETAVQ